MANPTTQWFDPNWQDGELISEIKLDAQQGSSDFLRDRTRNRVLFNCAGTTTEEYDTGGSPTGASQFRLTVLPTGSGVAVSTPEITMLSYAPGLSAVDDSYVAVKVLNQVWTQSPGSQIDFDFRWDWRVDSGSGWATLGTTQAMNVGYYTEWNKYISVWLEAYAVAGYREFGRLSAPSWVFLAARGVNIIGGRINEEFS
jgi:hypothetical protein